MDIIHAAELNNEALQLVEKGNLEAAERKHLAALELKMNSNFRTDIGVALTKNGLGELYLKMGKLEQAQELFEYSYAVRNRKYFFSCIDYARSNYLIEARNDFDAACTADNLGRLYEMKGDMKKAREWRTMKAPDRMICTYFEVRSLH